MHPDTIELAALLDETFDAETRARVRAHALTCAQCAARLRKLRSDAALIAGLGAARHAPDVRAAVRLRLGRTPWRTGQLALLAAVVLLALLLPLGAAATARHVPNRLFVLEAAGARLVALDASTGVRLGDVPLTGRPISVRYDERRNRLFVLASTGLLVLDPTRLDVVGAWHAPRSIEPTAGLALDSRRGLVYIALTREGQVARIDMATLTAGRPLTLAGQPSTIALSPDGRTLYAIDQVEGALWTVTLPGGMAQSSPLGRGGVGRGAWLAVGPLGATYALRGPVPSREVGKPSEPPSLWRVGEHGRGVLLRQLAVEPAAQDLVVLDGDRLALARGDGRRGGIEVVAADGGLTQGWIGLADDVHRLVVGDDGALYALNWQRGTVTRYDVRSDRREWTAALGAGEPRDAALVPGGWRLPWLP